MKTINLIIGAAFILISSCTVSAPKTTRPVDLVYPQLDTENSRWIFFSSACRPFGMVNLSPDNKADADWGSGYRYEKDSIQFFSHIHGWQLSGVPVMPVSGAFKGHLGSKVYGSKYSHNNEIVKPGYHSVFLESYGIKAELTSTTRVGFHRYQFPQASESYILLDLATLLGPSGTVKGKVKKVSDHEIQGYALMDKTTRRPKQIFVYFNIQFDTDFEQMSAWKDGQLSGKTDEFEGSNGGVYLKFDTQKKKTIQMKVGISYVSEDQAKLNIQEELPHWDFDRVVTESSEEWNSYLSRIEIEGGTLQQQRRFYTDLWHALLGRRIISDVNGKYCDMTGAEPRTGQIPLDEKGKPLFNHHNSDSFWGAQWTISTLWSLVYPQITSDFVNSMLMMYDDGGLIPRGPAGGNYTAVMTGASSTPFIVGAYMKGIRSFDAKKAYEGMKKNHLPGGMMGKAGYEHNTAIGGGIEYYIERGYVPYPLLPKMGFHQEGAAQTLEYASQDWCLAQMAQSLGKQEDYDYFMKRSSNWKNLYDAQSGWIRPKNMEGKWKEPFDPYQYQNGFVEANAAQTTWFVPQDLKGLAELMGGKDKMAAQLEASFVEAEKLDFTSGTSHAKELHPEYQRIPINYGNQPSIQTAFVFNHIGHPWLTQYWSRKVVDQAFSALSPDRGYNGDEDQGLMGSLAVLMKIGLFEMNSGAETRPIVELGSPIFDKITIHLDKKYYSGKTFVIEAKNNKPENYYIQSATLNGKALQVQWLFHDELVKGGKLTLEMGGVPNKYWGVKE
ncbi:MAG: GH92 family glycosyl hydrolase [Bacteroidota bacterium]|nr:GH92 family glycosyl hydrolase [Bacteroidota bacterium]